MQRWLVRSLVIPFVLLMTGGCTLGPTLYKYKHGDVEVRITHARLGKNSAISYHGYSKQPAMIYSHGGICHILPHSTPSYDRPILVDERINRSVMMFHTSGMESFYVICRFFRLNMFKRDMLVNVYEIHNLPADKLPSPDEEKELARQWEKGRRDGNYLSNSQPDMIAKLQEINRVLFEDKTLPGTRYEINAGPYRTSPLPGAFTDVDEMNYFNRSQKIEFRITQKVMPVSYLTRKYKLGPDDERIWSWKDQSDLPVSSQ